LFIADPAEWVLEDAMTKPRTLTAAFAHFGATPRNTRWSWSAVTPDERTVVLTLWEDETAPDGSVDFFGHPKVERWKRQHGNKERIANLEIARRNCGGEFRVVRIQARDPGAIPRAIADRYPDESAVMRLTRLDTESGEFAAVQVR
jgi:hypothetical protein